MERNDQNNPLSVSHANEEVSMRGTRDRNKLKKCNQCDYSTCHAGTLNRHMKGHSGEKPNKCNQCDYASSLAANLRTHLKTHSGDKSNKCNQCDCILSGKRFEEAFENTQLRKGK